MDPDMNIYDLEHVTTAHAKMSPEELAGIYEEAWHLYYSPEHVETLLKRAVARGSGPGKLADMIVWFYGSVRFEGVHPLQAGILRIKERTQRRSTMKRVNPLIFYPRRAFEFISTAVRYFRFYKEVRGTLKRITADPACMEYTDIAIEPVGDAENEKLDIFRVTAGATRAVTKAKANKARIEAAKAKTAATA